MVRYSNDDFVSLESASFVLTDTAACKSAIRCTVSTEILCSQLSASLAESIDSRLKVEHCKKQFVVIRKGVPLQNRHHQMMCIFWPLTTNSRT